MDERRFEDLPAWQAGHAFALGVYRLTEGWQTEETPGLRADARGAAVTVPAKIANGWGGYDPEEPATGSHLVAQIEISRRALREAETLLLVGHERREDPALERLLALGEETRREIDRLVARLPEPEVAIDPFYPPFGEN